MEWWKGRGTPEQGMKLSCFESGTANSFSCQKNVDIGYNRPEMVSELGRGLVGTESVLLCL